MVFVVSGISAPAAPLGPEFPGAWRTPPAPATSRACQQKRLGLRQKQQHPPRPPGQNTPRHPANNQALGDTPGARNLTDLPAKAPRPRQKHSPRLAGQNTPAPGEHPRRLQPYGFASKSASAPGKSNNTPAPGEHPWQKQQHPRPRRTTSVPALAPRTERHVINYK